MGYNLNFYLKPKKRKSKPMLFYSVRTSGEFSRAFEDALEGDIPFNMDGEMKYYDMTNDDFNRVADEIKETIESSKKCIERWKKEEETNVKTIGIAIANLVTSNEDWRNFDENCQTLLSKCNNQDSISSQEEYMEENKELLHNIQMLQCINMMCSGDYSWMDFNGICVEIH